MLKAVRDVLAKKILGRGGPSLKYTKVDVSEKVEYLAPQTGVESPAEGKKFVWWGKESHQVLPGTSTPTYEQLEERYEIAYKLWNDFKTMKTSLFTDAWRSYDWLDSSDGTRRLGIVSQKYG